MSRLSILPAIMVAPNGARRSKADHPALPVSIPEIVDAARSCCAAGAGAIHAHVRDAEGAHVLDVGLYQELIAEMALAVPNMPVQITTESAGLYTASQQRALFRRMMPEGVSIALNEMLADGDRAAARRCYHTLAEAGVEVQHILYDAAHVMALAREIATGTVPATRVQVLYVLGRYTAGQSSDPTMIAPFLKTARDVGLIADWSVCAFGPSETACLLQSLCLGGKARVGFENNLHMADGSLASDNAARVREIFAQLDNLKPDVALNRAGFAGG
jgi:3-keto-5-aminohexanoate cleavage enzyme